MHTSWFSAVLINGLGYEHGTSYDSLFLDLHNLSFTIEEYKPRMQVRPGGYILYNGDLCFWILVIKRGSCHISDT